MEKGEKTKYEKTKLPKWVVLWLTMLTLSHLTPDTLKQSIKEDIKKVPLIERLIEGKMHTIDPENINPDVIEYFKTLGFNKITSIKFNNSKLIISGEDTENEILYTEFELSHEFTNPDGTLGFAYASQYVPGMDILVTKHPKGGYTLDYEPSDYY